MIFGYETDTLPGGLCQHFKVEKLFGFTFSSWDLWFSTSFIKLKCGELFCLGFGVRKFEGPSSSFSLWSSSGTPGHREDLKPAPHLSREPPRQVGEKAVCRYVSQRDHLWGPSAANESIRSTISLWIQTRVRLLERKKLNRNIYRLQQQTLLRDLRYWEDGELLSLSPLRTAYLCNFDASSGAGGTFPDLEQTKYWITFIGS